MNVKGLHKTTLIDYPGKIACTFFLFGCNFRCGFCHNPELVLKETGNSLSETEIFEFLDKRKKHLEGVCITGGEPLMTITEEFLRRIKLRGYLIKLDTNGSYPEKLKEFLDKGLVDFVSMDIKSSKENYSKLAGVKVDFNKISSSIKLISNLENYEFRTTIIEEIHTKEEMIKIAKELNELIGKKPKRFSLQAFRNQGKLLNTDYGQFRDTTSDYLQELKTLLKNYFEQIVIFD